jgi:hypothetical protein
VTPAIAMRNGGGDGRRRVSRLETATAAARSRWASMVAAQWPAVRRCNHDGDGDGDCDVDGEGEGDGDGDSDGDDGDDGDGDGDGDGDDGDSDGEGDGDSDVDGDGDGNSGKDGDGDDPPRPSKRRPRTSRTRWPTTWMTWFNDELYASAAEVGHHGGRGMTAALMVGWCVFVSVLCVILFRGLCQRRRK